MASTPSRSCCRWIRPACGHTSTRPVHARTPSQGALSCISKAAAEPADHAIGRSRGGLTTKIHALTVTTECPVAIRLTAGQAGDNPQLIPLLEDHAEACREAGVPGRRLPPPAGQEYPH